MLLFERVRLVVFLLTPNLAMDKLHEVTVSQKVKTSGLLPPFSSYAVETRSMLAPSEASFFSMFS